MEAMSLVQVEQLQKSFGGNTLFAPFSAQIGPGDRVALIGDNGVGKSTLLRLLSEDEMPSSGVVRLIGGARVGYLPQAARLQGTGTLFEAMEAAFAPLQVSYTRAVSGRPLNCARRMAPGFITRRASRK
jgi:ATP-binding cassette subfamily F protein 3